MHNLVDILLSPAGVLIACASAIVTAITLTAAVLVTEWLDARGRAAARRRLGGAR